MKVLQKSMAPRNFTAAFASFNSGHTLTMRNSEVPDQTPEVMTIDELTVYLNVPKSTLYKLVRSGAVPSHKVGRQWRFHKQAIDEWLTSAAHSDDQE